HGAKIRAGKDFQKTDDFMIIARTEALIRGYGIKEAIKRAEYYVKSGADMILIHSREASGKEALDLPKHWKKDIPLVIVPTKFPRITCQKLFKSGYSMVILANQTERMKIKAIRDGLKLIKENDSLQAIEKNLSATLDDMRSLTPISEAAEIDKRYKF
ncbi:MAG: isocitrate lyase/phosphoenolpyruvate mutase family protein, partial [Spirochaetes bacterium]|nr:isocitrate lyase/phosphoenolpyruvate mutase family protein [Spirochaetota bacterium]